jgi:hypothetical protein
VEEVPYTRVLGKKRTTVIKFYRIPISNNNPETMIFFRRLPRSMGEESLRECLEMKMSMVPLIAHNTHSKQKEYLLNIQESSLRASFSSFSNFRRNSYIQVAFFQKYQ